MSLINSSLYDQWPLRECKGVHVLGTCSWDCVLYFQGAQLCTKTLKMGLEHGSIYIS